MSARCIVRRGMLLAVVVSTAACSVASPVPRALRGREFPLVRVDGRAVHGAQAVSEPAGSPSARVDCRDRVADGSLLIGKDGRSFAYRSTMRGCDGEVLSLETNEGTVELRTDRLIFTIVNSSGPGTFRGTFDDTTVTIFQLGGTLEFRRS